MVGMGRIVDKFEFIWNDLIENNFFMITYINAYLLYSWALATKETAWS